MIGRSIAHYEITAKIGEGGMGEVYRATDTKLKRDVALKILPESFARDPERMARFQREAEVLAALNHPNIAAIYGIEEVESRVLNPESSTSSPESGITRALVMELVEGSDLSHRIGQGAMAVDDAIGVALQIACALEAAHEKGIIHRDLKPANVIVTPTGTVKVLDFGLAKALDPGTSEPTNPRTSEPTMTSPAMTQLGVILGTAAYMSPEQARGTAVDKRCDIWAFGVVLHEMLTGKRLFHGDTVSDVLAHVLTREPDWDSLPADVPPSVRRLLRRCLQRSVDRRLRDIGEARVILEDPASPLAGDPVAPVSAAGTSSVFRPALVAVLLPLLALLAVWGWWPRSGSPPASGVTRSVLEIPEDSQIIGTSFSPDGTRLAYALQAPSGITMMIRRLDELEAQPVPGAEEGVGPSFSPDGEWIAYTALTDGKFFIRKIRITGGRPITVAPGHFQISNPSWSDEGWMVVPTAAGLTRVADTGGTPELLTHADVNAGESHGGPHLLPGGNALIYSRRRAQEPNALILLDLRTGTERVLLEDASEATYLTSGHLVFVRDNGLYGVSFDLGTMSMTGPLTPLGINLRGPYAISPAGHLVYTESADGSDASAASLVWMNLSGDETPLPVESRQWRGTPRLSPDGRLLVGSIRQADGNGDRIWKYDLERSVLAPLTFDDARNRSPILSPDGRQVTFRSDRDGPMSIYRMASDGSGAAELLLVGEPNVSNIPLDWTPDGTTLLFVKDAPDVSAQETADDELWTLQAPFGTEARPQLLLSARDIIDARLSPDGDLVAYASRDTGRSEVYVVALSDRGARAQVSRQGGTYVMWANDGKQLFYRMLSENRSQIARLMAVDVDRTPALSLGPPREHTELTGRVLPFGVDDSGERLLAIRRLTDSRRFVLVTNWTDEVARR